MEKGGMLENCERKSVNLERGEKADECIAKKASQKPKRERKILRQINLQ